MTEFSQTHAAMVCTLLREGRVDPDRWTRPEREAVTRLHQYRDAHEPAHDETPPPGR